MGSLPYAAAPGSVVRPVAQQTPLQICEQCQVPIQWPELTRVNNRPAGQWHILSDGSREPASIVNIAAPWFDPPPAYQPPTFPFAQLAKGQKRSLQGASEDLQRAAEQPDADAGAPLRPGPPPACSAGLVALVPSHGILQPAVLDCCVVQF